MEEGTSTSPGNPCDTEIDGDPYQWDARNDCEVRQILDRIAGKWSLAHDRPARWRAASVHGVAAHDRRHQSADAVGDAAPTRARRLGHSDRPPGGSAASRLRADRARARPCWRRPRRSSPGPRRTSPRLPPPAPTYDARAVVSVTPRRLLDELDLRRVRERSPRCHVLASRGAEPADRPGWRPVPLWLERRGDDRHAHGLTVRITHERQEATSRHRVERPSDDGATQATAPNRLTRPATRRNEPHRSASRRTERAAVVVGDAIDAAVGSPMMVGWRGVVPHT